MTLNNTVRSCVGIGVIYAGDTGDMLPLCEMVDFVPITF